MKKIKIDIIEPIELTKEQLDFLSKAREQSNNLIFLTTKISQKELESILSQKGSD